ncbi:MAG: hypothetical protein ACYTBJ_18660, partial [Planctomycetota bacterium]
LLIIAGPISARPRTATTTAIALSARRGHYASASDGRGQIRIDQVEGQGKMQARSEVIYEIEATVEGIRYVYQ